MRWLFFKNHQRCNRKINLTAVLRDVDVHTQLRHPAPWEVGHATVSSQVSELHVHDLQAAGARSHVWVAAEQDQTVRVEDRGAVFIPGVIDLVLRGGINVARQLEVPTHLNGLTVLVGVWCYLEGQVAHRCVFQWWWKKRERKGLNQWVIVRDTVEMS